MTASTSSKTKKPAAAAKETAPAEPLLNDLATMNPVETTVMVGNVECRVKRIRMRELMLLARVVANGAGQAFATLDFRSDDFQSQITAVMLMALPNAYDEFSELVQAVVVPTGVLSTEEWNALRVELRNPDVMVGFEVAEIIAVQEKDTFQELLGKAKAVLNTMQAVYRKTGTKTS
jgi:hypothetical protein